MAESRCNHKPASNALLVFFKYQVNWHDQCSVEDTGIVPRSDMCVHFPPGGIIGAPRFKD